MQLAVLLVIALLGSSDHAAIYVFSRSQRAAAAAAHMRRTAARAMHVSADMHIDSRIKDGLIARRRMLLDRYRDELDRADEELDAPDLERVGRAADRYDADVLLRLGDKDAGALQALARAIERVDQGTYGRCVSCQGTIAAQRLSVLPEVALCFACAARIEHAV